MNIESARMSEITDNVHSDNEIYAFFAKYITKIR